MKLYLTKHRNGTTREITDLAASWTWSGDKASICRQLDLEIAFLEGSDLPVPEIGDLVTMVGDGRLFAGVVLRRTAGSEDTILSATCFDYGIYLQKNDCTAKFTGATPEEITWSLCGEKGIPVASLPTTGISLRRKFSSVKINQAIVTVWSLAAEKNGTQYAIRYTPEGLLVKERTVSASSLVLKAAGNLMDATTTEDATNVVNSVAIYDKNGNFLRLLGDAASQELVGVMETHVTQNDHSDTINQAKRLLEDGYMTIQVQTPCLLTCVREMNAPRYMTIKNILGCYQKPVRILDYNALKDDPLIDLTTIGLKGSPTNIFRSFTPPKKEAGRILAGTEEEAVEELVSQLVKKHVI